jgi:hypothetical protein
MKELHMSMKDIGDLTFPQSNLLAQTISENYKEQRKEIEAMKIQGAIRKMRHG